METITEKNILKDSKGTRPAPRSIILKITEAGPLKKEDQGISTSSLQVLMADGDTLGKAHHQIVILAKGFNVNLAFWVGQKLTLPTTKNLKTTTRIVRENLLTEKHYFLIEITPETSKCLEQPEQIQEEEKLNESKTKGETYFLRTNNKKGEKNEK